MAKKGLTEIVAIIDKSGSMSGLQSKTIEGFNEFLNDQKELDEKANFSLILFSSYNKEQIIFDSIDINEATELNKMNYAPRGTTALYDAIGKTIKSLNKRIKNLNKKERPERVLFVILTDGQENSSRIFNKKMISKMINKKEKKNKWNFIYLGSNQDSFTEGGAIGVKSSKILNYDNTPDGTQFAYTNISNYTKMYRKAQSTDMANKINFDDVKTDEKK